MADTTTLDRLARIIERQQDRIEALERELSAERAKPRVGHNGNVLADPIRRPAFGLSFD